MVTLGIGWGALSQSSFPRFSSMVTLFCVHSGGGTKVVVMTTGEDEMTVLANVLVAVRKEDIVRWYHCEGALKQKGDILKKSNKFQDYQGIVWQDVKPLLRPCLLGLDLTPRICHRT